MIVCSCNVFSDHQLRSALAGATQRQRMRQIYDSLGGSAQCGGCARTIKRIMEEILPNPRTPSPPSIPMRRSLSTT